jgi:hypothetical protein
MYIPQTSLGIELKIRVRAHDSSSKSVVKYSLYSDPGRGHNAAA